MRIALVTKDWFPNGGVAVYLRDLACALADAGHDVIVVHTDRKAPPVSPIVREVVVEKFADPQGNAEATAQRVVAAVETFRPHVVHVHACNNFWLEQALRQRFPSIKTLHTYDFCPADTKFHFALDRPCRHRTSALCVLRMAYKRCVLSRRPGVIWRLYRRAAAANRNNAQYLLLLVASEYVRRHAEQTGYPPQQVRTLPYFTPAPTPWAPRRSPSGTIVFSGRLGPEKGLLLLLHALERLRGPWQLVVAGEGYERARAERLARRLGFQGRVAFRGWTDRATLQALYREATVMAMPSRWPEPFGLAGLEALAHGVPVVAFAVGGIPEWLEDGQSGFLVTPYRLDVFADRLARLLDDPELAVKMGAFGREQVIRRFSAPSHVSRLIAIYEEVVQMRAGERPAAHA